MTLVNQSDAVISLPVGIVSKQSDEASKEMASPTKDRRKTMLRKMHHKVINRIIRRIEGRGISEYFVRELKGVTYQVSILSQWPTHGLVYPRVAVNIFVTM